MTQAHQFLCSFTQTQKCVTHKQVSRLGFILLGHLPAMWQWYHCPFVDFTVTGIVQDLHLIPSVHCCMGALRHIGVCLFSYMTMNKSVPCCGGRGGTASAELLGDTACTKFHPRGRWMKQKRKTASAYTGYADAENYAAINSNPGTAGACKCSQRI